MRRARFVSSIALVSLSVAGCGGHTTPSPESVRRTAFENLVQQVWLAAASHSAEYPGYFDKRVASALPPEVWQRAIRFRSPDYTARPRLVSMVSTPAGLVIVVGAGSTSSSAPRSTYVLRKAGRGWKLLYDSHVAGALLDPKVSTRPYDPHALTLALKTAALDTPVRGRLEVGGR